MPAPLSVLLGGLRSTLVAVGLLAVLTLVGFHFLPRAVRPRKARLAIPLALSAGALLVGWSSWLVGTFLGTAFVLPFVGLLAALSVRSGGEALVAAHRVARELAGLARRGPLLALAIAALLALCLPQLLLPLCDSDGTRYHVALPKLFLLEGRVTYYPWDFGGAYPQTVEMLYLVAVRIGGLDVPKFVHAGFFAAALATLALLVHDRKGRRASALLAVLFCVASPVMLVPATAAFVDHAALFHLAVAALLLSRRASGLGAGLSFGAAFAAKITSAPAILGSVALAIPSTARGKRLRTVLLIALSVTAAFLPFGIRNLARTGDPFYPAGHVLLGVPIPGFTEELRSHTMRYHEQIGGPIAIPWGAAAARGQVDEVVGWHHLIGLVALVLAVRERSLRPLLGFVLPYLVLAAVYRPPARYLVPAWFALSAFEGVAAGWLWKRRLGAVAVAAAAPAAIVTAGLLVSQFQPIGYLLGREGREAFLRRVLPGYSAGLIVNAQPPGGRVMALDFPSPVYFDRPWIVEGVLLEPPLAQWLRETPSAEALLARLQGLDVRYLVVTPGYGGGTPLSLLTVAASPERAGPLFELRKRLRLVGSTGGVDVYRVPLRSDPSE